MTALRITLAGLLLLTACSAQTVRPTPQPARPANPALATLDWETRKARLTTVDRFSLSGRVASSELDLRADLRWRQSPGGVFDMRLSGPFGAGAVELHGDANGGVQIKTPEGTQYTRDPEGWIRTRYGWTLPIRGLRYWALGVPAPGSQAQWTLDPKGRAATLTQNGWQISYPDYQAAGRIDLPRRFDASNGQLRLKLIVDRWEDVAV